CFRKFHLLPSVRSIKCLMTLSSITPIVLLSLFQHQEPRFLIPIIIPLVYLHGPSILPEVQDVLVEALKIRLVRPKNKKPSYVLLKVWFIINTLLMIFYGFIHQGGVYRAVEYFSQDLRDTPLTTEFHIVTSHIYSIPESFLLQRPSSKLYKEGKSQYSISRRVFLYEEGSKEIRLILKQLQVIIEQNHNKFKGNVRKFKVYLLISSSLEDHFNYLMGKQFLNFYLVKTFYPHLSMEAFPDFSSYCLNIAAHFYGKTCTVLSFEQYFSKIFKSIGLNLYQVTLNNI
ncbi:GPI mannosyltransferase 4-like, partial [Anoplophora glabripennis]|uniref:GPI mannosyltransferase 4-like n=1 Tax=Anoplophora glabripennis TaxID=217634 RepID=UPI0008747238